MACLYDMYHTTHNTAENTQHYSSNSKEVVPQTDSAFQVGKKTVPLGPEMQGPFNMYQVSKRSLYCTLYYSRRSGIRSTLDIGLFVSFLRHSPSHFPEGNLVLRMGVSVFGMLSGSFEYTPFGTALSLYNAKGMFCYPNCRRLA